MNRRLRRRHRWMTGVLAVVAIGLLLIAWRARRVVPASDVPASIRTAVPASDPPAPGTTP